MTSPAPAETTVATTGPSQGASDLRWTWVWVLDVPPEALWPAVSDTDRFNHLVGLPPLRYRSVASPSGIRRREAAIRRHGIPIVWEEDPFEFEEPRYFSVRRRYRAGPVTEMDVDVELRPHGSGTELVYGVRVRPRFALARLPIRFEIGVASRRRFERAFRSIAAAAQQHEEAYRDPPALDSGAADQAERALANVPGAAPLAAYLRHASDRELFRIRPFRLAAEAGLTRESALALCVDATKAGVLDALWNVICPHCRGPQAEAGSLRDLPFESHCDACGVDFTADFDRLTELIFRISPRWKTLRPAQYCLGGPGRTPHIVLQFSMPAAGSVARPLALAPGTYRVRAAGGQRQVPLEVEENGPGDAMVTIAVDGCSACPDDPGGGPLRISPRATVVFQNARPDAVLVSVERTAWADEACSAAYVTCHPQHRDLFGAQVLAPGVAVRIGTMAVVFTDLKNSTTLYRRIGDATAFSVVRAHFDVLGQVARQHGGVVIKTIGDAVMACFLDPVQAVRAAVQMHRDVGALQSPDGVPLVLKIGLHAGPCFAVSMNQAIDYFGTTVNLAAKIQTRATGGDIVLADELLRQRDVTEVLQGFAAESIAETVTGSGAADLRLVRVSVLPCSATANM